MKTKSNAGIHDTKVQEASVVDAFQSSMDRWHPKWNERDLDVEFAAVLRVLSMHAAPRGAELPSRDETSELLGLFSTPVRAIEGST